MKQSKSFWVWAGLTLLNIVAVILHVATHDIPFIILNIGMGIYCALRCYANYRGN